MVEMTMHVDKDSNVGFRDEEEREEDQITEGNFLIPVLNPQVCCLSILDIQVFVFQFFYWE